MYNYKSFQYQNGEPALHFNDFVIFRKRIRPDEEHTFKLIFNEIEVPFSARPIFERRKDNSILIVSWDLLNVRFSKEFKAAYSENEKAQKIVILNKIRFFLKNYIPSSEAGELGSYKESFNLTIG
jgi:hypothetical protein